MTPATHARLKTRVYNLINRNGIPIRAQNIAQRLAVPVEADLDQMLTELVAEGRIFQGHTLLVNGDTGTIYDVLPAR